MRAEELMINDWIVIAEPDRYAGATGQIKSLSYHQEQDAAYFYVFIQGKFGYLLKEVCSDDIRPIPLTPEILEKNGFIKSSVFEEWKYEQDGTYILWTPFQWIKIRTEDATISSICGYVHKLQHALKYCGINNTIITV